MLLDGTEVKLDLHIKKDEIVLAPLVSVILNNQVVWDGYLDGDTLSISIEPQEGQNALIIRPINRDIVLASLSYQ